MDRGVSDSPKELPHNVVINNLNRAIYRVSTDAAHGLFAGDQIFIEGSAYEELNQHHELFEVGKICPAAGTATVDNGAVTGVVLTDQGGGYRHNFYVSFYGGGGVGAYAYAEVDDIKRGGKVLSITMVSGGHNYTSAPNIEFGDMDTDRDMLFYTDVMYGDDSNITYSTTSSLVQNEAAYVKVTAPGLGYNELPEIKGLYKRGLDTATFKPTLNGTTVATIAVTNPGSRYVNPMIIEDLTSNGEGATATATVADGIITLSP